MIEGQTFLTNIWYHAIPSRDLKVGQMLKKELLGEPVLFMRGKDGKVAAVRDVCPHRGIPLSYGRFDGCEVECCYHGWRFGMDGGCTSIPSLVGGEGVNVEKIKIRRWAVVEQQGQIWIFWGDPEKADATHIPHFPGIGEAQPNLIEAQIFPCHIDHAVVGLMDPAHGPFVHQSWWWRNRRSIHEKAKKFGPTLFGWAMLKHRPSSNSAAYKILGGTPETEIRFQLPGIRIEHIAVGKHTVINLTCVTPINERETQITNSLYWTMGWLTPFRPLMQIFARTFLGQDRDVVVKQQEGLKHEKNLLLIKDADTQARWYYQLKNEYQRAHEEEREFTNPVKETVLKWRS